MKFSTIVFVATIGFCSGFDFGLRVQSSLDKDLTITLDQKRVLDKFRRRVEGRLVHEYMKTDLYLVRWLRAKNFRVQDAEEMLMNNLAWRKKNKMDGIHNENWSKFQRNYPYTLKSFDRQGKPILYFFPGSWDLRRVALSNDAEKFRRYIDKAIDEAWLKVKEIQEEHGNVTQGMVIVNLQGYNVVQHACLQCIPIILRGILTYENHYPGIAEKVIIVNTPAVFEPLLATIRGVLSPPTNKALRIYGNNRKEWKSILQKYVEKDQLSEELGGTLDLDISGGDYF